jgi:hypothetical protein
LRPPLLRATGDGSATIRCLALELDDLLIRIDMSLRSGYQPLGTLLVVDHVAQPVPLRLVIPLPGVARDAESSALGRLAADDAVGLGSVDANSLGSSLAHGFSSSRTLHPMFLSQLTAASSLHFEEQVVTKFSTAFSSVLHSEQVCSL